MMSPRRVVALLLAGAASIASQADAQSLRGSRASVNRMHRAAVHHDLHFYQTSAGVRRAVRSKRLVPLRSGADYALHRVAHPYVRPAARTFVERLAHQYRAACGERLVVTGATRPSSRQPWNASRRSVHPAGIALDLRTPMNARCRGWLQRTLLALEGRRVIEATQEFGPPHFHVVVYPDPYRQYLARSSKGAPRAAQTRVARAPDAGRAQSARRYVVRPGDSLWSIARRHDTTVDSLKRENHLAGGRILPGQTLKIPVDG